jgi:hypothetical protein
MDKRYCKCNLNHDMKLCDVNETEILFSINMHFITNLKIRSNINITYMLNILKHVCRQDVFLHIAKYT